MEPELSAGNPLRAEGEQVSLILSVPADLAAAMDTYAADAQGHPDRAALLLRIARDWLVTNGYLRSDPLGANDPSDAG